MLVSREIAVRERQRGAQPRDSRRVAHRLLEHADDLVEAALVEAEQEGAGGEDDTGIGLIRLRTRREPRERQTVSFVDVSRHERRHACCVVDSHRSSGNPTSSAIERNVARCSSISCPWPAQVIATMR